MFTFNLCRFILTISTCLNALSCRHVIGYWIFATRTPQALPIKVAGECMTTFICTLQHKGGTARTFDIPSGLHCEKQGKTTFSQRDVNNRRTIKAPRCFKRLSLACCQLAQLMSCLQIRIERFSNLDSTCKLYSLYQS